MFSERYGVADDGTDIECVRLAMPASAGDPGTFRLLERVGVEPGFVMLGPTSIATVGRKPRDL